MPSAKLSALLGHRANKYANALVGSQCVYVVADTYDGSLEAQGNLPALGRKVVRDRVRYYPQEFFLRVGTLDGEAVEKLNHQPGEPLKGSRNTHGRRDLDQDPLGRLDVDLQLASFVDWRIKEGEQALVNSKSLVSGSVSMLNADSKAGPPDV